MADSPLTLQARWTRGLACIVAGVLTYFLPAPAEVTPQGWTAFAVFVAVIVGLLYPPFPMGAVTLLGLVASAATGALSLDEALGGYGKPVVWLVLAAFLLASGLRETGLGKRIALLLVRRLGRSTLGLGYAQAGAELALGPVVPSNTARGGGILASISASLSRALGSRPGESPERAGAYLTLVGAHTNLVTAAMFLTGMAANPLLAEFGRDVYEVDLGWGRWLAGSIVPGLLALGLLPLLLYFLSPPTLKDGRPAQEEARRQLDQMGPPSPAEWITATVFVGLLVLWSTKRWHGLDTTLVALLGVSALILSGALRWERVIRQPQTWDTLVWLGGLLALATGLKERGVIDAFAALAADRVSGLSPLVTVIVLVLVYYYSMYGFSMLTAHITAMGAAFLAVCKGADVPPLLAIPLFAYFSNLCACLTNYSTGPVVIYFGLGYVSTTHWFRVGFVVSLFHAALWIPVGLLWWRLLGWW